MSHTQQTGDPNGPENQCAKCGHPAYAHTNYTNGIPAPCYVRKSDGEFCRCKPYAPPTKKNPLIPKGLRPA